MVAKIADFGLQQDKGFGKRAAHPYSIFWQYLLGRVCGIWVTSKIEGK